MIRVQFVGKGQNPTPFEAHWSFHVLVLVGDQMNLSQNCYYQSAPCGPTVLEAFSLLRKVHTLLNYSLFEAKPQCTDVCIKI